MQQVGIEFITKGEKQAQQAIDRLGRSTDNLGDRILKGTQVAQRLERQFKGLDAAVNKGKISLQAYSKATQALNARIDQAYAGNLEYEKSILRTANAHRLASTYTQQTARRTNQLGVLFQQTGYQVGDFAVQVQSGTNVMVALGQQATQLVGTFGMLARSTGAIAFFAALGIAVPILTAIVGATMRVNEETQKMMFDFTAFFNDVYASLEPLHPAIDAIGTAFSAIGNAASEAFNFIIKNLDTVIVALVAAGAAVATAFAVPAVAAIGSVTKAIIAMTVAAAKNPLILLATAAATLAIGLYKLVDATGGWGEALKLLGEVAVGVWNGIVASADAIPVGLSAIWEKVKAGFFNLLSLLTEAWSRFLGGLSQDLSSVVVLGSRPFEGIAESIGEISAQSAAEFSEFDARANSAMAKAESLGNTAKGIVAEGFSQATEAMGKLRDAMSDGESEVKDINEYFEEVEDSAGKAGSAGGKAGKDIEKAAEKATTALEDAYITTEEFADLWKNQVVQGIENVSGAFTDFIMSGLRNFESFADAIKSVFRNLIATLVQTAIQNQIVIPIVASVTGGGIGGIGGIAGGGGGGGFLGGGGGFLGSLLGTGGGGLAGLAGSGGFLGGLGSFASGLGGVLSGGGLGSSFSMLGGIFSGSVGVGGGSMAAALGAALPAIGIIGAGIAAVASLFKKKTTVVGQGLDIAIDETEALVQTFTTLRKKSLFGKSKYSVVMAEAPESIAGPIVESVNQIQDSIKEAAAMFGIGADAFSDFTYHLMLDLRGLTEEEQIQKVTEELSKMGDEFTALSGVFENMNELLEAANQRMQLQNRLDQLLGNNEAILARQREAELAAIHPLNRAILESIHILEDAVIAEQNAAQAVANTTAVYENALAELRRVMADQLREAEQAITAAESDLQRAIEAEVATINSSFDKIFENLNAGLDAASEKAAQSRDIFELLDRALRDRRLSSETTEFASRQAALQYVASGGMDANKLSDALDVLNEPSEKFFGTFQDYARDFALTSNVIEQSRDMAKATMTADELAVRKLEEQIKQAKADRDLQVDQVEGIMAVEENILSVEEAVNALRNATAERDLIVQQHEELIAQFPDLEVAILSISDAVNNLARAQEAMFAAESARADAQGGLEDQEASATFDDIAGQINQAYQEILGRNVDVAGLDFYGNILQSGQANMDRIKYDLQTSQEAQTGVTPGFGSLGSTGKPVDPVEALYGSMLGREADPAGLDFWKSTGLQGEALINAFRDGAKATGETPRFAMGGMHTGGLRMVGERGPELEVTGPARIYSSRQTADMMRDPELVAEVRALRSEVSSMKRENTELMVNNNKYTKRSYDLYRKWDIEGIPAERT